MRSRLSALLLVAGLLVVFSACRVASASGPMVSLDQKVEPFDAIEISHAFDVKVTRGDTCQVTVRVNESLKKHLQVEVRKGTLVVGMEHSFTFGDFEGEVDIVMPALTRVDLSGACDGEMAGEWTAETFSVNLSGASSWKGQIQTGRGRFELSGASSLELSGGADTLELDGSGASDFDLGHFPAGRLDVELSGASKARVEAREKLDADLSGASSLRYSGDPVLGTVETSGASSVGRAKR